LPSFAQQQKSKEPDFPTTEEIQLVITQAERAFVQYNQSVEMEATLPTAKKDKSALEKDRQVFEMSEKLLDGLKKRPEAFYGLAGLLLLTTLDDASRNAALCANTGMADVAHEALSKVDTSSAYRILAITQQCSDVSLHLYTVSESVNALYVRTVEAQGDLNQQMMETLDKCSAAMKNAVPKK
jgi:hypothetical protein